MTHTATAATSVPLVAVWLSLSITTACAAAGTAWLAVSRRTPFAWWGNFVRWSLVLVTALAVADLALRSSEPAETEGAWVLVRLAAGLAGILLATAILAAPQARGDRWSWAWTGGIVAALVLSFFRLQAVGAPQRDQVDPFVALPIEEEPDETGAHAVTDRGKTIRLRRYVTPEHEPLVPDGFDGRVIVADSSRSPSNCHGWVFTGGRFQVGGADVATILADNGYVAVATPRPADLIVYRDEQGKIVHTGLVKATGPDGFVLVESKWGPLDIYWHTPHDQVYSRRFEYWRSPRAGHELEIVAPSEPPAGTAGREPPVPSASQP